MITIKLNAIDYDNTLVGENKNSNMIKWVAYQEAVKQYPIILSKSTNKVNAQGKFSFVFAGFNQWSDASKVVLSRECIYEDFKCCKAFIDYEYEHPYDDYVNNKEECEKNALIRLKTVTTYIDNAMEKLTNKSNHKIFITKSHGIVETEKKGKCYKFSYHFVVGGPYRFRNSRDAKQLVNIIRESTNDTIVTDCIDNSVYKKDPNALQKMRCVLCPKTIIDRRILVPIDRNGNVIEKINICDYLISHNEANDIIYLPSLPNDDKKNNKKVKKIKQEQELEPKLEEELEEELDEELEEELEQKLEQEQSQLKQTKNIQNSQNKKSNDHRDKMKIVFEKLKKEIPSVYMHSYKFDPTANLTFYTYNYNHTEDMCIHKNGNHDHIAGYAYIRNDIVYAGCYSKFCKDKKTVQVGNILETSYWSQFNFEPYEEKTSSLGYESENESDNESDNEENESYVAIENSSNEYNDKPDIISDDEPYISINDHFDMYCVDEIDNKIDNEADDKFNKLSNESIRKLINPKLLANKESEYDADNKSDVKISNSIENKKTAAKSIVLSNNKTVSKNNDKSKTKSNKLIVKHNKEDKKSNICAKDNNDKSTKDECISIDIRDENNNQISTNDTKLKDLTKVTKLTKEDIVRFKGRKILKNRIAREEINNFVARSGKKALCIRSRMCTGKTYALRKMIRLFESIYGKYASILVISTRRSYACDVANAAFKHLGFVNYLDRKTDLAACDRLIISLESLYKLSDEEVERCYDMIILDESESVMDQFFSKTVENKHYTYCKLEELIEYSKKIVVLDADLDNRTMEYIMSITSDVRVLCNEYKGIPRKYIVTNDDKRYIDTIIKNLRDGENICVVSLGKDFGISLRDRLRTEFPNFADKIVCLHKFSDDSTKAELNDIRKNWSKYRVLIYTSVVGCGLNYDIKDHFNRIYGYALGATESVRMFIQMVNRIRYPTNRDINILLSSRMSKRTDSLLYSLEYALQYKSSPDKEFTKDGKIVYVNENGGRFMTKKPKRTTLSTLRAYHLQEHLNNKNSNFLTMFKILVEEKDDIFVTEYTEDRVGKMVIKKDIERILEVNSLDFKEYGEITKKSNLTENDKLVIEKTHMKRDLNFKDDVPEDELNKCLKIDNKKQLVIKRILNKHKKMKNNDNESIDDDDDGSIDDNNPDTIYSAYDKVITALDCNFVRGIKKYDVDDCDEKMKSITFTAAEIKAINIHGKGTDKYEIIKAVLGRFGIILRARIEKRQRNKVRKKERVGYDLIYDKDIYNVIYCKIINDRDTYNNAFVTFVNYFIAYKRYVNIKNHRITDLPYLFK
jgi:hypothetical protein